MRIWAQTNAFTSEDEPTVSPKSFDVPADAFVMLYEGRDEAGYREGQIISRGFTDARSNSPIPRSQRYD